MKSLINRHFSAALLSTGILLPQIAFAAEWINPGGESFVFAAGVFLPAFDSVIRLDNTEFNIGDQVDLENDLGLQNSETTAWLRGQWRFSANHRVSLSYFQIGRSATATALENITIGEETYPAGATLSTSFKFRSIPITYHYSFIKSPKHEFSGTAGLQWNTIDLGIKGNAYIGGSGVDGNTTADALAPLPLFGLEYSYHANKRWTSGIHGEVFAIHVSDETLNFSGKMFNLRASTEYWFFNNFGVGLAVNWFSMDVDIVDSDWKGKLNYEYIGPQIYAQTRF